jgi:putative protease
MDRMIEAGVRVFKIEGRARGAEYVRTVTECYKEALIAYLDGTYGQEKVDDWTERLSTVFNRGFWDGYYMGQRLGEWTGNYGSAATKRKVYIGKGIKYFANIGVAEFLMETQTLKVGDEILITGPTTGAVSTIVEEIRVDLKSVEETIKGEKFSIRLTDKIRPSDKLFKVVDAKELKAQ